MSLKEYRIYFLKNKYNEIIYCGLTRNQLSRRFYSHVSRFKLNIRETKIELVIDGLTIEEAVKLESMYIKHYDLIKNGLNSSPGSINGYSNYHSEEQKEKWRKERPGKPVSKEHAAKNRLARVGLKNSEYHKRMVSEKKSKPVYCFETDTVYSSGRAAAKALGVSYVRISDCCRGTRKSTKGYSFAFKEKKIVETNRNDSSLPEKEE